MKNKFLLSFLFIALICSFQNLAQSADAKKNTTNQAANAATASQETEQPKQESLLNKLFAPGPLSESHKALEEKDCLKCHDAGKGLPENKCLECHKEIAPFVENKKGFHGLTEKRCIDCHFEHKGRELDTTLIDQKNFDHSLTGYKLTGKHANLKCVECHKDKRSSKKNVQPIRPHDTRYLGQTTTCVSCHKKDDIHSFRGNWAKKDCDACHGSETWKKVTKFNHDKDTKYKLVGHHADLKCSSCHKPTENKKGTTLKAMAKNMLGQYHWDNLKKSQCLTCHADIHGQNFSKKYQNGKCETCHTQTTWAIKTFDHKITGYPLRGKHAQTKCVDCHKQSAERLQKGPVAYQYKGLKSDCLSCHKENHYFGRFSSSRLKQPNQCLSCHNESDWKKTHDFNHTVDTRFILDGKHGDLKCADCHRPTEKKKGTTLKAMSPKSPGVYHWDRLNQDTCSLCHTNPHTKTFSKKFLNKKCTECHVADGWLISPMKSKKDFNHNSTRFALTGRHTKIDCSSCHNLNGKQIFKFNSFEQKFCIDCHDNPHVEQFHEKFSSQSCVQCHSTDTFKKQKEFDHDLTAFRIKGKHETLKCSECHTPESKSIYAKKPVLWHKFKFENLAKDSCSTCHKDFHNGQLSQQCNQCHTEQGWKKLNFDHDTKTDYPLKDKHRDVKCSECHLTERNTYVVFGPKNKKYPVVHYSPISSECVTCHKKDDHHKGQLGPRCQNCHSERSWKVVKDFHKNFTLHGTHFTLTCAECHRQDRKLAGMSDNCALCHQKDDVHNGSLPNCGDCHRQQFWEHASFRHSMTGFPIRGSHRALDCFACHNRGIYQGTPSSCTTCHSTDVDNTIFNHNLILNVQECNECHNQFTFDLGQ